MAPRSTSRSTSEAGADGGRGALVVGLIRAPHGIRGELRVEPRSDVPDRFRAGAVLDCDGIGPLTVESIRGAGHNLVVRFAGVRTRADADRLRERLLRVAREEARRALPGRYLWADLVGLRAETPAGEALGEVREVLRAGETDVLVVERIGGGELLLPTIESVIREVDLAGGRIVVAPQEEL